MAGMNIASGVLNLKGIQDAYIVACANALTFYKVYREYASVGRFIERIIADSENKLQYNSAVTQRYKFDSGADIHAKAFISLKVQPLVAQGNADFMHLVNRFGYACIKEVIQYQGNLSVENLYGECIGVLIELLHPPGSWIDEMVGNFETEAQLIQAAQYQQEFLVPLPLFWTREEHQPLVLCQTAAQESKLNIEFRPLKEVIVNRGDDTALVTASTIQDYFDSPTLFVESYYLTSMERNIYSFGRYEKFDVLVKSIKINPSSTQMQQHRPGLAQPTKGFILFGRETAATDGSTYTKLGVGTKDYFDFGTASGKELITKLDFNASSNKYGMVTQNVPDSYFRSLELMNKFDYFPRTPNVYCWSFDYKNLLQFQSYGGMLNFSRTSDPSLEFAVDNSSSEVIVMQLYYGISIVVAQAISRPFGS